MFSLFAAQLSAISKAVLDERHEGALCQLFHGTWIERVSLQLRGPPGILTKPLDKLKKAPIAHFTSILVHTPGVLLSR